MATSQASLSFDQLDLVAGGTDDERPLDDPSAFDGGNLAHDVSPEAPADAAAEVSPEVSPDLNVADDPVQPEVEQHATPEPLASGPNENADVRLDGRTNADEALREPAPGPAPHDDASLGDQPTADPTGHEALEAASAVRDRVPVPANPALGPEAWKSQFREDLLRRGAALTPEGPGRDLLERLADREADKIEDKRSAQQNLIETQRIHWRELDGRDVLPELRREFPNHDPHELQRTFDRAWADEIGAQNIPDARRVMNLDRLYERARDGLSREQPTS